MIPVHDRLKQGICPYCLCRLLPTLDADGQVSPTTGICTTYRCKSQHAVMDCKIAPAVLQVVAGVVTDLFKRLEAQEKDRERDYACFAYLVDTRLPVVYRWTHERYTCERCASTTAAYLNDVYLMCTRKP